MTEVEIKLRKSLEIHSKEELLELLVAIILNKNVDNTQ